MTKIMTNSQKPANCTMSKLPPPALSGTKGKENVADLILVCKTRQQQVAALKGTTNDSAKMRKTSTSKRGGKDKKQTQGVAMNNARKRTSAKKGGKDNASKDQTYPYKEELASLWVQKLSEKLMSELKKEMLEKWFIKMEAEQLKKIKATVSEEMEGQKRQMLDVELQKTIVAKDLTKRREERGGYDSVKALTDDQTMRLKMER